MGALPTTLDLAKRGRHPGLESGAGVWLIRHGEVREDWQGRVYGGLDVPLSAAGIADTAAAARRFAALPFRRVLTSSLQRARALGEALSQASGAPLEVDPALAEVQRGRWQGMASSELRELHPAEVAAYYADPWEYGEHGGESDRGVLARAWPPFERAVCAVEGGLLAVACHYNVLRVLIARAVGIAPEASFRVRIDLAAACYLVDGPNGWVLERANVRHPEVEWAGAGAGA
jgi:broad specificity phosphatase PhoE